MRSMILAKLEMDPKLTLQKITEACQRIVNIKLDTASIEKRNISNVYDVRTFKKENTDLFKN